MLDLGQKEAGEWLGVTPQSVPRWGKSQTEPPTESMHVIVRFSGYDPFPEPKSIAERLPAKCRAMGRFVCARQIGRSARLE